jgi:outer membrane protein OmpA-like peptidoglycan-associated protein
LAALALILFFSWFRGVRQPDKVVTVPAPTTQPAPAPARAAPTAAYPAKVFFDVGEATINEAGKKTILDFAQMIKGNQDMLDIVGYTDQTGDSAQNQEIAKQRAKVVRDALVAAGVPESRMSLKPPASVMSGAGSDAEARRVEITKAN